MTTKAIPAKHDLTGKTFHRWTVKEFAGVDRNRQRIWKCLCSCGTEKVVQGCGMKSGASKSCGCLQIEVAKATHSTHGATDSPEYHAWECMWQRTTNPNNPYYEQYKDRTPSPEFKSYEFFISHVGPRPSAEYSLDRIDNTKGYVLFNLRWATRIQQNQNMSNNVWYIELCSGNRYVQADVCKRLGLAVTTLIGRLQSGWDATVATNGLYRKEIPDTLTSEVKITPPQVLDDLPNN